ncbi:alpha-L-arabinofuranosidase [Mucilaginibacter lappiensis]|nr:alpha-L-arabinofuranosidase [Mucilaginibacter lappiensis]
MKIKLFSIVILCIGHQVYAQNTQGFFLNGDQTKMADMPKNYIKYDQPKAVASVEVSVDAGKVMGKVSKYIYGNNTNPYMTNIIGQPALLNAIKTLKPQVLRYPGGNLSNVFFWNASPGEKPSDVPDTILYGDNREKKREQFWYGRDERANTLSLNNYYATLKQTNSTGIICVNYGYARYGTDTNPVQKAAHLAAEWVRHDKGRTQFWEVGNENYGTWQAGFQIDTTKNKDHQPRYITGQLYGAHFKVFADSMKAAARQVGATIYVGAVIIETLKEKSWEGVIEKNWNTGFFKMARNTADFFIVHSYYTPYNQNSSASVILNTATAETTKIMAYMHQIAIDCHVDLKPIALTEWNIFASGSKQACSYINGIHAAIVLGELAKNKYGMASRWDLANGYNEGNDHGMFSKGDEPGVPVWNPRPVYYYMYYFQKFFGDKLVESSVSGSTDVLIYASKFTSGEVGLVIVNKGLNQQTISIKTENFNPGKRYYLYTLTGGSDNGEFSQKVFVNGKGGRYAAGGPPDAESIKPFSAATKSGISINSPAYSVQYILIDNEK